MSGVHKDKSALSVVLSYAERVLPEFFRGLPRVKHFLDGLSQLASGAEKTSGIA